MPDLEVTTFFEPITFKQNNNEFLTNISNQNTEIEEMNEFLIKLNESIEEFKEALNIKTETEYKGIGGFFKKMNEGFEGIKKKLNDIKSWLKNNRKKILITGGVITVSGAIIYIVMVLL
jgi:hypothetical protein